MARLSKFDREIKNQMQDVQGEPSAKVWMGIREEIGTQRAGGKAWLYRSAAAILLLTLAGASIWWYFGREPEGKSSGVQMVQDQVNEHPRSPSQDKVPFVAPDADQNKMVEEAPTEDQPVLKPEPETERYVVREVKSETPELVRDPEPAPSLENEPLRSPELGLEGIVERVPKTPREKMPEQEDPEVVIDPDTDQKAIAEVEDQPESAATHRRQYNLNQLRNISKDQVKEKSGAVLGSVANQAKKVIGLETEVSKSSNEQYENNAYSVRLGPIKLKRSRKLKK